MNLENMSILLLVAAPILSFIINLILTPIIIRLSDRNEWYDYYNAKQKIHKFNTSRLGGIGLFISFIVTLIIISIISKVISINSSSTIITSKNIFLLIGFLLVHVTGLIDDFKNISAKLKLIGQLIASIFITIGGISSNIIYIPISEGTISLGIFASIFLVFWFVSLSNAINIIDGMDGLAGSIVLIASIGIGIINIIVGNYKAAIYSFTLSGSIIAFLFYNKPLAQIFMGDSGALFLGIAVASLVFIGSENNQIDSIHFQSGFIICITVLIVPISDMIITIIRRIQQKRPIFSPDKFHYYHRLLNIGVSVQKILGGTILHSICMLVVVIIRTQLFLNGNIVLGDSILVLSWIISFALLLGIHYRCNTIIAQKKA